MWNQIYFLLIISFLRKTLGWREERLYEIYYLYLLFGAPGATEWGKLMKEIQRRLSIPTWDTARIKCQLKDMHEVHIAGKAYDP